MEVLIHLLSFYLSQGDFMSNQSHHIRELGDIDEELIESGLFTDEGFKKAYKNGFEGYSAERLCYLIGGYCILSAAVCVRNKPPKSTTMPLIINERLDEFLETFDVDLEHPENNHEMTAKYLVNMAHLYLQIRQLYPSHFTFKHADVLSRMLVYANTLL